MTIIDSGTFHVAPGEFIAVSVDKTDAPYLSSDSLFGAVWSVPLTPIGLSAHGGFVAPATVDATVSLSLSFDFAPAADGSTPPGDRYEVVIHGHPGEDTRSQTIFAGGLQSRSYTFHVV